MHAPSPLPGLRFDIVDLVGRPGTQRLVERTVPAPAPDEITPAMWIPQGDPISVDASLESVVEGIYATGTASTTVVGACSRCLDPLEDDLEVRFGDLFTYPERVPREMSEEERDELLLVDSDDVDLGTLVHDALVLAVPTIPLCRPDCEGLCAQCGFRMEDDPDHHHEVIDDRFAALHGFFDHGSDGDEKPSSDGALGSESAQGSGGQNAGEPRGEGR